jgi:transcriptional regulator with XRE-family HTH domain
MTQTALAERLGINLPTVNRWINQGVIPDGPQLMRLPELLGVSGHWLLTGKGEMVHVMSEGEAKRTLDQITKIVDDARGIKPLPRPTIPMERPVADGTPRGVRK